MRSLSIIVAALIVSLASQSADACHRCRRFGTSCAYYKAPAVAPITIPTQTDVFVVQNNYPQPMVGQGNTYAVSNGGLQAALAPLFDLNQYASQRLQLAEAYRATGAVESERLDSIVARIAAIQAPVAERLAAGQAASQVLTAAGLNPTAQTGGNVSTAVVINRDAYGRVQVVPLTPEQVAQVNAKTEQTYGKGLPGAPAIAAPNASPEPAAANGSLTAKFCGSCHGANVGQPKAGLRIAGDGASLPLVEAKFYRINKVMESGSMPPADSPQPTAEEKAAIIDEIVGWLSAGSGKGF